MALLTVFLLLLPAFSAEGIWSDAIYHARHEAGVLQNTFSPAGSLQSTSLMHFHIYWASFACSEQASQDTLSAGGTVLVTQVSESIE